MNNDFLLIGYSGHAYVACDIINSMGHKVFGYFEKVEKEINPYKLQYLGSEKEKNSEQILSSHPWMVAIGNNHLRKIITDQILTRIKNNPSNIIHYTAILSNMSEIGIGCMVSAGVVVNSRTKVGNSVILNTKCIVEHECVLGDFSHIAPGAVLAGNVKVGERSFVGANAVVKEGINIGNEVRVGAGSVIIKDVPNGCTIVGNPGRIIRYSV